MARQLKQEEYDARRKEILAVAHRLVQTKGYDQMSIQDILDELGISKGAFYHYFSSKSGLLEGLIEHLQQEMTPILMPIVQDPYMPALEKLHRIFDLSARWKIARKDFMLEILRVWYHDDNALFRQRVFTNRLQWFSPILAEIIHQGNHEGVFNIPYPDQFGEILFSLFQGLGDSIARMILDTQPCPEDAQRVGNLTTAYNAALERVLGLSSGSLTLIEPELLGEWFPNR